MLSDNVFKDVCFSIELPVPEQNARRQILDLAAKKLDKLYNLKELPDQNLSTCFWPNRCQFVNPCHRGDAPNGKYGFVKIDI